MISKKHSLTTSHTGETWVTALPTTKLETKRGENDWKPGLLLILTLCVYSKAHKKKKFLSCGVSSLPLTVASASASSWTHSSRFTKYIYSKFIYILTTCGRLAEHQWDRWGKDRMSHTLVSGGKSTRGNMNGRSSQQKQLNEKGPRPFVMEFVLIPAHAGVTPSCVLTESWLYSPHGPTLQRLRCQFMLSLCFLSFSFCLRRCCWVERGSPAERPVSLFWLSSLCL